MCGILVIHGIQQPFHHRLLNSLRRRGPDAFGFWSDRFVQMAQTRLAILGLDDRGDGPFENETHVLAYTGEIYNFADVRARLQDRGIQVSGANDGEVLLHAWSQWGPDILTDLHGFWAFVAYDKRRHILTLVRDQFGIKPLYYWRTAESICVSSLFRTIVDVNNQPGTLDYSAISEYVRYQFTFGDKTFFKEVKKVLPGHLVELNLDSNEVISSCYEDIFATLNKPRQPLAPQWIEETRDLLAQCIFESTVSDTPLTTFCSGGLDSSLITRIAVPEVTYHCNYSDPECNETFYAQQVIKDTPIRMLVVNAQESFDLVSRLRDIVNDFDELTIGSVILPLEDLLAQVKRRYKVALTGTGGDELFAGYVRYQLALGECYQDSYKALYAKMRHLTSVADRFEMAHRKGAPTLYKFYQPGVEATFKDAFDQCKKDSDDLQAMLRFDQRYFLPGLLNIDDKMGGRHSLENRPCLLHQKFVRRILSLEPRALLRNGTLKPVLRDLAFGQLPKSVIHRTDKMGFTTPIGDFVNRSAHLIREQIMGSRFRDFYDLKKINFTAETKFSREVFGLLMLDLWLNRYATAPSR